MELISVKSSNIAQIGYEEGVIISMGAKPKDVLRVVFTSGTVYDYYGVESDVFEQFLNAKSIGSYFHKHIKNNYTFEKK